MATITLTKDTFDEVLSSHDTLIIDFWASWCGPCTTFAPTFTAASDAHQDIGFAKVDTEDQQELAQAFGVSAIPTLAVFRDQILLFNQPGALSADMLDDLITQVRDLDMDEVRRQIQEQSAPEQAPGDEA